MTFFDIFVFEGRKNFFYSEIFFLKTALYSGDYGIIYGVICRLLYGGIFEK